MPIKAVFHDWNGTLVNDIRISYECLPCVFDAFAPGAVLPSFENWRREQGWKHWLDFYRTRGIPEHVTASDIDRTWMASYKNRKSDLVLNDGAIELLTFCQKEKVANVLLSGGPKAMHEYVEHFALDPLFACVMFDAHKKDAAIAENCASLRVTPSETVYIGDTVQDMLYAKAAGTWTIAFSGGCHPADLLQETDPDYLVHSLRDAIGALNQLLVF